MEDKTNVDGKEEGEEGQGKIVDRVDRGGSLF